MNPTSEVNKKNEEIQKDLCRFCGEPSCNHLNIDNSWNETFFDVTKKLFSFTVEILNGLKICTKCFENIESICKFYKKVKNVSSVFFKLENFENSFKVDIRSSIVQSNVKYTSSHEDTNDFDNLHEEVVDFEHVSDVLAVEYNSVHSEEINIFDDNQNIDQEIVKIEKQEILQENDISENYSKVGLKDILLTVPLPQSLKIENINSSSIPDRKTTYTSKKGNVCEICGKIFIKKNTLEKHRKIHLDIKAKLYECSYCDKKFSRIYILRDHLRIKHLKENLFECRICNQEFKTKSSLRNHQKENHVQDYKCEICGKTLSNLYQLKAHRNLHLSLEEQQASFFKCPHCELKYPAKATMLIHVRNKHSNKKYSCEICGKQFSTKYNLKDHGKQHLSAEERKYYKCEICGKEVTTSSGLTKHKKLHLPDVEMPSEEIQASNFECLYCDSKFSYSNTLANHIRNKHTKCTICTQEGQTENFVCSHQRKFEEKITPQKKIYKCEICEKILSSSKYLEAHKKLHLPPEERERFLLKCPHCELKYLTKHTLFNHVLNKHSDAKHMCETCGKEFSSNWNLKLHKVIHLPVEERHYKCDTCGKNFSDYRQLRNHIKMHLSGQEKLIYNCTICGEKFNSYASLSKHRRSHFPEKETILFKCSACDISFPTKVRLEDHVRVNHSKEKPFECKVCNKAFATRTYLYIHKKRVHQSDKNKFECKICNKAFAFQAYLSVHKKRVHSKIRNVSSAIDILPK